MSSSISEVKTQLQFHDLKTIIYRSFDFGSGIEGPRLVYWTPIRMNRPSILCPGLDHIFIRLGPAPATLLLVPGLPACTCVGTLPRREPT